MYTGMEWWTKIRLEVLRGETSKRAILRRENIHWETLKKILQYPEPPGYRSKTARPKPKLGPFLERIAQIIEDDKAVSKKQRHTSKRIYERLKAEGYRGGCRSGICCWWRSPAGALPTPSLGSFPITGPRT